MEKGRRVCLLTEKTSSSHLNPKGKPREAQMPVSV